MLPSADGAGLVAMDQARREKVYAQSTNSSAKPPLAAPGASYAAAAAVAPTSERTLEARAAMDKRDAAAKASAAGARKSYVVVKGDTLSGIAKKNGVSVTDLRDWNSLKNDNIKLGQSLQVGRD